MQFTIERGKVCFEPRLLRPIPESAFYARVIYITKYGKRINVMDYLDDVKFLIACLIGRQVILRKNYCNQRRAERPLSGGRVATKFYQEAIK